MALGTPLGRAVTVGARFALVTERPRVETDIASERGGKGNEGKVGEAMGNSVGKVDVRSGTQRVSAVSRRHRHSLTSTLSFQKMSQTTLSPHTQAPLVTRQWPSEEELDAIVQTSANAQKQWQKVSLDERLKIADKFVVSTSLIFPSHTLQLPPAL